VLSLQTRDSLTRFGAVREYLVENFKFDDTRLKTVGLGKRRTLPMADKWDTRLPGGSGRCARKEWISGEFNTAPARPVGQNYLKLFQGRIRGSQRGTFLQYSS
jgi:hypothetical protein